MSMMYRTNRESSLSSKGIDQIDEACKFLKEQNIAPTVVRYSLATNAIESTDSVGRQLKVSISL
jgi:phosphohistidine phosphatase SixA